MSTRQIDQSQAANTLACTVTDADTAQTMPEIHEGQRLAKLLDASRYEKKEFGQVAGNVTKQAVNSWVKQKKFSPAVWEKIVTGLKALKLDPSVIRPTIKSTEEPIEDLTRLVENWSKVQLTVLKRILETKNDASLRLLLFYVNGALRDEQ